MPLPREGEILHYTRWQQNFNGIIRPDIAFIDKSLPDSNVQMTMDARLAYRSKDDADNAWKLYATSLESRDFNCKSDNTFVDCSTAPLFELESLQYDFYLLNIRLTADLKTNSNIESVKDMHLVTIQQAGYFTNLHLSLKTIFFVLILVITIWFWNRVFVLQRKPVLLEYALLYLGGALTVLNSKQFIS